MPTLLSSVVNTGSRLAAAGQTPIHKYNGNYYWFGSNGTAQQMFKSSTGLQGTWAVVDLDGYGPTAFDSDDDNENRYNVSFLDSQGFIHVFYMRLGSAQGDVGNPHYVRFNCSNDTWGNDLYFYGATTNTIPDSEPYEAITGCQFAELGNGDIVMAYCSIPDRVMGNYKSRVSYRKSTDNGVNWGAETALDAAGDVHYGNIFCFPSSTITSVHFFWQRQTSTASDPPTSWGDTQRRTDNNGTLNSVSTSAINTGIRMHGWQVVLDVTAASQSWDWLAIGSNTVGQLSTLRLTDSGTSFTVSQTNFSVSPTIRYLSANLSQLAPHLTACVDPTSGDVYVYYADLTNEDIYEVLSSNGGSTFGSASSVITAQVNGNMFPAANWMDNGRAIFFLDSTDQQFANDTRQYVEFLGGAITATGSPSITNPTSTGSATDVHITTGSPSTTNPTSTGVAELIRTASGAATLAAITAAGVAAPFIAATGSPSITNPTSTGVAEIVKTSTGTPSITNPTSTGQAEVPISSSGSPSTTNATSSGTSEVIKTASGASAILNVTSSGVAEVVVTSTGTPSTTNVTSTGSARTFIDSTGTPSTVNPTSAGVSEIIKTSSGTPSTTNVTSTGVATSEAVFTSSGTPSTTNVTSSGVSEVINTSSGTPSTTNVTSAGVAEIERTSSGSPSTTNVTSAGVSEIIRIASGSPSITAVISSGVSEIERTSSGSPSTTNVTSSGSSTVERSASGAPSVANPTSSGIASLGAQGVIGNSVIQSNAQGSESTNTYSTPTGYEILGTALDGSSEYILVCFGHLGGSNNSNNECRARIIENGVGLVTGSNARIEPRGSGSNYGNHYGFVKKVTTSATPNDYEFQIRNNNVGVNTTTKAIHMMMLKLADLDTGDWAYAEDATSDLDIPSASWLDRDSVTIGDGNSTYLVFGHAQFEADNTSDDMRVILDIGGTEYGEYRMESEDPVEEHPTMVVAVVSGIAASTTAKIKVRSAEGIVNVIHSSIFALRLNAFEDWFVELDTTTSQTLISTVETDFVASTKTHTTSTDSARDWIIGSTTRYNIQSTANRTPQNKISDTTNSIEIGTTTNFDAGDAGAGWYHNGLNDIPTITRFNRISAINNGTNLDLDVVTRDSFETGHGPIDVTWWGFTTQLATVVTSSGTPSTTNPTSSGSSDVIKTASGSPSTTNVTSAGVSEIIRTASGSPSITAVISSGVSEVERTSSGSPSITNPTSAGVAEIVREASGAPSITNVTSAGSATRSGVFTSSGTPSITNPTSTGLATRVFTASGTPSITNVTSSGASHMWPKVYLNTSQTLAGATELTVTAASATSITFDDAVGPPVGSLFLGVENRNNGDVGWIAVTVTDVRTASGSPSITNPTSTGVASVGETFTASGTPSTTNVTSSGVAEIVKTASGTPSVTNPTSTGVAEIVKTATGTPSITNSTSTGIAEVIRVASGTPSITNSTSTGVAEVTRTASGAPSTTNVTSSGSANSFGQGQAAGNPSVTNPTSTGVAEVSRIASGSPSIVNPTSTGVVEVERLASGTPSIPNISSTGAAEIVGTTTGSPSITNPASTGVAEIIKTASGTPSIENLTASGSSNTFGTGQAAGNPSINGVTSTGETTVIRKASGSPSTNNPTSFAFATFVVTASGSPSITSPTGTGSAAQEVIQGSGTTFLVGLVTSSGVAEIYRFASGASVTSNPTSTGVAEVVNTTSGSPSLDNIISSGVSEIIKTSSGSPSIEQVLSSGSAQTFIDTQGSPSLQQFTSTGSVRVTFKTNGTPSITPITGVGFTNFIALFPVTDYEIESQALETRFATNWIHTPIQWPNVHFDTRGVTEWVRFENNRDDSTQLTLGRNVELYRYFGEVIVEINVRPNSGANRALQLADLVDEVWRSAIFGVDYRIRMRAPRLEFVGNDRGWYKLRVVTPYQRDGYQNRSI